MNSSKPSTTAASRIHAAAFVLIGCLSFGYTSTEKAIAPLGFGPLAKAEEADQERLASQRQQIDRSKPARGAAANDFSTQSFSAPPLAVEKPNKAAAAEPPAPSAAASANPTPAAPSKVTDWLGLWRGKDTTRYQIPSFPPQPMDDPTAKIRVESSRSQQIKLILIDSTNDKDICGLTAQLESNQAKIDPGQPCFGSEDDSSNLSIHVKSGLATLREATLVLDLALDADVQSEQFQANGTVEYHFEGKRM